MSSAGSIHGMNLYDSVMFWGTILMVVLEIMIVLLLIYDVGLHTVWGAWWRKIRRQFKRRIKKSLPGIGRTK